MNANQEFDSVTGFVFFLTSLFAVLGAWRYSLHRTRAYSRNNAGPRAARFPKGPQLRLGKLNGEPSWLYSYSW